MIPNVLYAGMVFGIESMTFGVFLHQTENAASSVEDNF